MSGSVVSKSSSRRRRGSKGAASARRGKNSVATSGTSTRTAKSGNRRGPRRQTTGVLKLYRYVDKEKVWCDRWFQLRGGLKLVYGEEPDKPSRYCFIEAVEVDKKRGDKHQFKVSSSYPEKAVLHLRAPTDIELSKWVRAIEKALEREGDMDRMVTRASTLEIAALLSSPSAHQVISEETAKQYIGAMQLLKHVKCLRHLKKLVDAGITDDRLAKITTEQLASEAKVPIAAAMSIIDRRNAMPELVSERDSSHAEVIEAVTTEAEKQRQGFTLKTALPPRAGAAMAGKGSPQLHLALQQLIGVAKTAAQVLDAQDKILAAIHSEDYVQRAVVAERAADLVGVWNQHEDEPAVLENFARIFATCCLNIDANKGPVIEGGVIEAATNAMRVFPEDYDLHLWTTFLLMLLSHMDAGIQRIQACGTTAIMKASKSLYDDDEFVPFNVDSYLENLHQRESAATLQADWGGKADGKRKFFGLRNRSKEKLAAPADLAIPEIIVTAAPPKPSSPSPFKG